MNFKEHMLQAKDNDQKSINHILEMYKPLLLKESIVNGLFDEDLYQELCLNLLNCIQKFRVNK